MCGEVGLGDKALQAPGALVPLFPLVPSNMICEGTSVSERLVTVATLVRLGSVVRPHVYFEVTLRGKALQALGTLEGLVSCV